MEYCTVLYQYVVCPGLLTRRSCACSTLIWMATSGCSYKMVWMVWMVSTLAPRRRDRDSLSTRHTNRLFQLKYSITCDRHLLAHKAHEAHVECRKPTARSAPRNRSKSQVSLSPLILTILAIFTYSSHRGRLTREPHSTVLCRIIRFLPRSFKCTSISFLNANLCLKQTVRRYQTTTKKEKWPHDTMGSRPPTDTSTDGSSLKRRDLAGASVISTNYMKPPVRALDFSRVEWVFKLEVPSREPIREP